MPAVHQATARRPRSRMTSRRAIPCVMRAERLSALDAAFLAIERPTAPMHVGWVALFDPPESGPAPRAEALLEHLGNVVLDADPEAWREPAPAPDRQPSPPPPARDRLAHALSDRAADGAELL